MLIKGNELRHSVQREVLRVFVNRWTVENEPNVRAIRERTAREISPNLIAGMVTDAEWITAHAFHVVKDGSRLMHNRHYAEPAYLADGEQ